MRQKYGIPEDLLSTSRPGLLPSRVETVAEWKNPDGRQESGWWAIKDLNLGPLPCEGSALTTELIARFGILEAETGRRRRRSGI